MAHNEKIKAETEVTWMIELVERDGKTVFYNCIPYA